LLRVALSCERMKNNIRAPPRAQFYLHHCSHVLRTGPCRYMHSYTYAKHSKITDLFCAVNDAPVAVRSCTCQIDTWPTRFPAKATEFKSWTPRISFAFFFFEIKSISCASPAICSSCATGLRAYAQVQAPWWTRCCWEVTHVTRSGPITPLSPLHHSHLSRILRFGPKISSPNRHTCVFLLEQFFSETFFFARTLTIVPATQKLFQNKKNSYWSCMMIWLSVTHVTRNLCDPTARYL